MKEILALFSGVFTALVGASIGCAQMWLVAAKLEGDLDWSWYWTLAPVLAASTLVALLIVAAILASVVVLCSAAIKYRRRRVR